MSVNVFYIILFKSFLSLGILIEFVLDLVSNCFIDEYLRMTFVFLLKDFFLPFIDSNLFGGYIMM